MKKRLFFFCLVELHSCIASEPNANAKLKKKKKKKKMKENICACILKE